MLREKHQSGDRSPIYQHLGGTPAEKLCSLGRARSDGMSLSRTMQILPGAKSGFLLVADSGAGEANAKGLIVPRLCSSPENHIALSLSFAAMCELLMLTRLHYQAWLTAQYSMGTRLDKRSRLPYLTAAAPVQSREPGQLSFFFIYLDRAACLRTSRLLV